MPGNCKVYFSCYLGCHSKGDHLMRVAQEEDRYYQPSLFEEEEDLFGQGDALADRNDCS